MAGRGSSRAGAQGSRARALDALESSAKRGESTHLHEGVLDDQSAERAERPPQHLVGDAAVQVAHEEVGVLLGPADADRAAPKLALLHRSLALACLAARTHRELG